jgi:TrmH family RNA methyltransferase
MLGRHHPTVQRLRALHRDAALRRAEGVFLAEGLHLAAEALDARAPIELLVSSAELTERAEGRQLLQRIRDARIPHLETTPRILASLQDARSPQPIVTLVRMTEHSLATCLEGNQLPPLVAVVCGIQDPGNLGSIQRSADAAGAAAFVVTGQSADLYHPRSVRAGMGSIFRLPAMTMDLDPLLSTLGQHRVATLAADPAAVDLYYDAVDLTGAIALFFGGEGAGLPPQLLDRIDRSVVIPMTSGVESLSVGAAAAVLLFEAARQRRAPES